jgi:O-antigen ligase
VNKITKHSTEENDSDWIGATVFEDKPSKSSQVLIFVLCGWLIIAVLAFGAVDPWALGLQAVVAAVVGLLWISDAWARGELRISANLLQLPLLALILIGLIQFLPLRDVSAVSNLLNAPASKSLTFDAHSTLLFIIQLVVYLIYFAAALAFINSQKRLRAVAGVIVVFGMAIAAFSIIQSLSSEGKIYWTREAYQANPFGTYVNSHHFATLMEMTLALTLGLLYTKAIEKEMRPLQIFAAIVMGAALILTGSRGGILSLLGVLGLLALMGAAGSKVDGEDTEKKVSARQRLVFFGGGGLLLFVVLMGVTSLLGGDNALLRGIGFGNQADDFSNGRLHFWQTSLEIIKNNLFFGVGLDAFAMAYTRYDTWNGAFRVERAHNDYLQILAETGIAGLILVIAFLAILFRQGWRIISSTHDRFRRGVALGSLAGCFGVAIHSFFDFPLRTPANALFFLTLAALATVGINYPKLHRRKAESRRRKTESRGDA